MSSRKKAKVIPFISIPKDIFKSAAYGDLDVHAQATYTYLRSKYIERKHKNGTRTGNAEDISLTFEEMESVMSRSKLNDCFKSIWGHGLLEWVRHGGVGKVCNIFRIDGYNEHGRLIRLPWCDWEDTDGFLARLKDGPISRSGRKCVGYGFGTAWKTKREDMLDAVRKGQRKRSEKGSERKQRYSTNTN